MPQLDYNTNPARGFAGLVERGVPDGLRTVTNEEAVPLEVGAGVAEGATERGALKLAATSDTFIGVVGHKHRDTEIDGTVGIPADGTGFVVEKGDVWVRVEEAIAIGDAVFVRAVAAGLEVAGDFRTDADGTDAFELTNARWLSASMTGEDNELVALLRLL